MNNAKVPVSLAAVVLGAIVLTFAATERVVTRVTAGDLSRDLSAVARSVGAVAISERLSGLAATGGEGAPLTEAGAVAMLNRAGFAASTSNPTRPLTRDRADALVRQFRAWAVGAASHGTSATTGVVPDDVETCFDETNHGQCVACCKALGGSASGCAKACFVINKPSPSEPLP